MIEEETLQSLVSTELLQSLVSTEHLQSLAFTEHLQSLVSTKGLQKMLLSSSHILCNNRCACPYHRYDNIKLHQGPENSIHCSTERNLQKNIPSLFFYVNTKLHQF